MIHISRRDIWWSYLAKIINSSAGLFILPFILSMLSPEEVGYNYLLLAINSFVILIDFGFSSQIARYVSYVFSGVNKIPKTGFENLIVHNEQIDYRLLKSIVNTSKTVYRRLSLVAFFLMISIGSYYIYHSTERFTVVHNALLIWIIQIIATFFNIYYLYLNSLLIGKGQVMESQQSQLASRLFYIISSIILLYFNFGLLGISIAYLISPFIGRFLAIKYFYDNDLQRIFETFIISKEEKKETFANIWYNSKKVGITLIGGFAITKIGMFMSGLYLSIDEVAQYGLMLQISTSVTLFASTSYTALKPKLAQLLVTKMQVQTIHYLSKAIFTFYLLFLIISIFILSCIQPLLGFINSGVSIENKALFIFLIIAFLERNHSIFANFILLGNKVPFVNASIISGIFIIIMSYVSLELTDLGVVGLILAQGIVQLFYNNWKWPLSVLNDLDINFFNFIRTGFVQVFKSSKHEGNSI